MFLLIFFGILIATLFHFSGTGLVIAALVAALLNCMTALGKAADK
jgi:hypothetical protein